MDDSTNPRKGSTVPVAIATCVFLLMCYVLSPGPVLWLLTQFSPQPNEMAGKCVHFVYAPLIWLYEKVPVVHQAYDWYFSLFGVR